MSAPKDPLFYVDLDAMAQRVGAKAEDLLLVWTSESDLNTNLTGFARTFSTLLHSSAVPGMMSEATWQQLPTMTARQQLPYVEKIYAGAHKTLGREYRNTFEVYLTNAAPALLRPDGNYNPSTVMYEGSNYPDNWPMDNRDTWLPVAYRDHVNVTSPRDSYDYAKTLVSRGILKGYVSLGDLQKFGERVLTAASGGQATSGTFHTALAYLDAVRKTTALGMPASIVAPPGATEGAEGIEHAAGVSMAPGYQPNFDAFPPGAPIDTRVASPEKARKDLPAKAGGVPSRGFSIWPVAVGGGIAALIALALSRR
jgi:hypothetical protein